MSAYSSAVMADSPYGYFRLGESSGTSSTDASGNSFTGAYGTISGSGPTFSQPGAMLLNDTDTSPLFNSSTNRNYWSRQANTFGFTSGPWSVEFWFKTNLGQQTSRQYLVGQDNGASVGNENLTYGFFLEANTMAIFFLTQRAAGAYIVAPYAVVSNNTWHHVVGTLSSDSLTLTMYVDGIVAGSITPGVSSAPYTATTSSWLLGATSGGGANYLRGNLDEIALYNNKALTPAQVLTHYNAAGYRPYRQMNNYQFPTAGNGISVGGIG